MKKRAGFMVVVCMGILTNPFPGTKHAVAAASAPIAPLVCSGSGAKASYLTKARKSPLYALLKSKLGEPTACEYKEGELLVKFAQGGTLTMHASPAIEFAEEEATLPASGATVSRDEAVMALKNVEKASEAYPGLGLDWTQFEGPIPSGDVLKEVEGDTCNAKMHIHMNNGVVIAVGDSIAC